MELPGCRPALLAELLALETGDRRRRGEVVTAADYAGRFPDLPDVVAETVGPAAGLPQVGGYEVLAEVGRGGMGVVYRARQVALNRPVALKMLLGGAFAAAHHLTRFLIEGETLAGMDHPDMVRVFEVGEQDGRPFLALEYVGGGTLADRVKAAPPSPRRPPPDWSRCWRGPPTTPTRTGWSTAT